MGKKETGLWRERDDKDARFIKPGYGFIPDQATCLWTVVGSTVAVSIFDSVLRVGGMVHYIYPEVRQGRERTSYFAEPALISLITALQQRGSVMKNMEAYICGGAVDKSKGPEHSEVAMGNVRTGLRFLRQRHIEVAGQCTGGKRGRKLTFSSGTGELIIAIVDHIRQSDWEADIDE